jgi:signal peptidase I
MSEPPSPSPPPQPTKSRTRQVTRKVSSTSPGTSAEGGGSLLRAVLEFGVSLALAVTLFRTFLAEGYVIQTGSMAPSLLGRHVRMECPSCRTEFATDEVAPEEWATCPNCQRGRLEVSSGTPCDGDQLFVFRSVFDYREPERWEVLVFRNPDSPEQAFVKRVVGFPGEALRIIRGDLYIDGQVQTKSLQRQRGMRIPVHDQDWQPPAEEADWKPRWLVDMPAGPGAGGWSLVGKDWHYRPPTGTDGPPGPVVGDDDSLKVAAGSATGEKAGPLPPVDQRTARKLDWVRYRHWLRVGGGHATSALVGNWPDKLDRPPTGFGNLEYDDSTGKLVVRGVLTGETLERLTGPTVPDTFRAEILRLAEASHLAPVRDVYSYNRRADGGGAHVVRDLMVACELEPAERGVFSLYLSDTRQELECQLDLDRREVRLIDSRTGTVHRTGPLPATVTSGRKSLLEFSLWDGQALVAVDGVEALETWRDVPGPFGPDNWRPARFGATGGPFVVRQLRLFRDVYYTAPPGVRGGDGPVTLADDEYFVLGDNSPVSRDSRVWVAGEKVTRALWLGKPFVVHLPTRRGQVKLGKWEFDLRIPEFGRMRYIR